MSRLPILTDEATAIALSRCTAAGRAAVLDHSTSENGAALLKWALEDQQQLTAVERFSQVHALAGPPDQAQFYRSLLPVSPPASGEQYAFEVDLDRCSGCKACVTACHTLNGLDEQETWRDVGLLVGGTQSLPVLQHVTTACHHCVEPACLIACPVNAYEKDPLTGIVKHLDDQCFGCQYCILACPYDVPKYNAAKGIVRKCDMCSDRLAVGEAPACVQACPHQAIAIKVVAVARVIEDAETALFLPAAPDPQITYPTTIYKTDRAFPRNMLPVDYFQVSPQHPHWPLVLMLVLTQLSVGAFAVGLILERTVQGELLAVVRPLHVLTALVFGLLAIGASVFHLGRPQFAFRAVLGLRHSWLSREILAFGLFAGLACTYAMAAVLSVDDWPALSELIAWLAWSVVLVGGLAVLCSVMIYASLERDLWSPARTLTRFLLTAAVLGVVTVWLCVSTLAVVSPSPASAALVDVMGRQLCCALIALASAKLVWEAALLGHLLSRTMTPLKRSAQLLTRDLSNYTLARFAAGILGGMFIPGLMLLRLSASSAPMPRMELTVLTTALFVACLAGELFERYLFFAAVAVPRMPGGIR